MNDFYEVFWQWQKFSGITSVAGIGFCLCWYLSRPPEFIDSEDKKYLETLNLIEDKNFKQLTQSKIETYLTDINKIQNECYSVRINYKAEKIASKLEKILKNN